MLARTTRGIRFICFAFAVACGRAATPDPLASEGEPALSDVHPNSRVVSRYEKVELTFQAQGRWNNPFDPEQVAIDCRVEPAKGEAFVIPAFFFQAYVREQRDGAEHLEPRGPAVWKVRVAVREPGTYRCRLRMTNAGRTVELDAGTFECATTGNRPGFIRVGAPNPHYFMREDGSPFFGIGENMLLVHGTSSYDLDQWCTNLARAGGTLLRTWWCQGSLDLESHVSDQPRRALGRYDLESAWRMDHQIELAELLGLAVMPSIETQQYFRPGNQWEAYTYNRANGGPLGAPAEFFTNAAAQTAFRNRLRYIVARWSYSPAVFAWQFWNEVDVTNGYNAANVAAWHRDMARYLRALDPNRHLICTNYGNLDGRTEVDDLPEIEFISTNLYSRLDSGESSLGAARLMAPRRGKPYLLTEYGIGHGDRSAENDPEGIALHDALWGAAMGGAAGGAMVWYWDTWVEPQNLYHHYAPFAATLRDVAFHRATWRPVEVEAFTFRDPGRAPYYASVFFEGYSTNYSFNTVPSPRPAVFTITPEGELDRPEAFDGGLAPMNAAPPVSAGSTGNEAATSTLRSERTLQITMPRDGQLILHVPRLAGNQHAILRVTVDGQQVFECALARERKDDPWPYFGQFPIALTAGAHCVTVANRQPGTASNVFSDRVNVAYELTNYRLRHGPNLDCAGLQSDDCLLLWLHHPDATWGFARIGRKPEPQPAGRLRLKQVTDGAYTVLWRDTWTGVVLGHDTAEAKGGTLELRTPPIERSAVAKLMRVGR